MQRRFLLSALAAGVLAAGTLPAMAASDAGQPAGYEDPFDVVYAVEFKEGQITSASTTKLDQRSRFERPAPKDVREDPAVPGGKIDPNLERLIASADPAKRVQVLVTYIDTFPMPRFPIPSLEEDRSSPTNAARLKEAQRLVSTIQRRRAGGYERRAAELARFEGKVLQTFWLIDGLVAELPLGAVKELVADETLQYIELDTDELAAPPADANPDNDLRDGRARVSTDPYFNLNQTAGWIGLLDTGVRATHTVFNGPDHLSVVQDLTGDGDPGDQCNHGTASASILTGNGNLGFDFRGASAITVDSFDIYGNDCLAGHADAVEGFETAVSWLDRVIVAELQLSGSESSAASTAADAAFNTGSVVIAANGNFGPGASTVRSPANAHRVIGIGAADVVSGALNASSGRGPTGDGRFKPDLVAPTNTESARSTSDVALGAFGGTSGATPYGGAAAALLRNWMRNGVGAMDPGHVYSHLILSGQTVWPFDNNTGAGNLVLPTGGNGFWGKTVIDNGEVFEIPITVPAGRTKVEAALWWPEAGSTHNDVDVRIIDPSGAVRSSSLSIASVFERARVEGTLTPGTWKIRINGYSVASAGQTVFWSARHR